MSLCFALLQLWLTAKVSQSGFFLQLRPRLMICTDKILTSNLPTSLQENSHYFVFVLKCQQQPNINARKAFVFLCFADGGFASNKQSPAADVGGGARSSSSVLPGDKSGLFSRLPARIGGSGFWSPAQRAITPLGGALSFLMGLGGGSVQRASSTFGLNTEL